MRTFTLFTATTLALSSLAACRQVLGIETQANQAGGPDADADAAVVVRDAGSPFAVVNGQPQGETLYGIWGSGPDFFVAVGSSSVSFVYAKGKLNRLGGNSLGRDYSAVWGTSDNNVYAVGRRPSGGFVDHFDGIGWTEVYQTKTALYGVWGVPEGAGSVLAVGAEGKIFATSADGTWGLIQTIPKVETSDDVTLWSISGRSAGDFTIAGGKRLFHWEPAAGGIAYYEPEIDVSVRFAWQLPGPTTSVLLGTNNYGVAWFNGSGGDGPPGEDAAVSYKMTDLIHDEASPGAKFAYIEGIWGTAEKIIAVGDQGRIYTCNTGTMDPKTIPSPTDESLGAVWGSSLDDVWIVGRRELILHGSIR